VIEDAEVPGMGPLFTVLRLLDFVRLVMSSQGSPGSGGGSSSGGGGGSGGSKRRRRRRRGGGGSGGSGGGGGGGSSSGGGGGGGGNRQGSGNRAQGTATKQGKRGGSRNKRRGSQGGSQGGGQRRRGGSGGGGGGRGRGRTGKSGAQRWQQKQPAYLPGGEVAETCDGIAEIYPDGHAFLRRIQHNLLAVHDDIHVPVQLVRKYNIGTGSQVIGKVTAPERNGQRPQCTEIESIDGMDPEEYKLRVPFGHLTTIDPEEWIQMEETQEELTTRVIDLLSPIGFGQRCLIVAPPRAGKTVILQKIGAALNSLYPNAEVFVLLINERPEEVTDIRRSINGTVVASSLDDLAPSHVAVSEMTFARAKRLVEQGKDVVILVDSLTRMARAYNMEIGSSGRTMSGGLDSRAMEHPKRHFGCARNVEGGGSLTVIATALIDTGSRMDQLIFEEFKGTGNSELVLSRKLAELRIYPALDISKSGTRKEEKILDADILSMTTTLRRVLAKMKPEESMELLVDKLESTPTNREFLEHFRIK